VISVKVMMRDSSITSWSRSTWTSLICSFRKAPLPCQARELRRLRIVVI